MLFFLDTDFWIFVVMTVFINFSFRWRAGMATVAVTKLEPSSHSPPRSPSLRGVSWLCSSCHLIVHLSGGDWPSSVASPLAATLRLFFLVFHGSPGHPKYSRGGGWAEVVKTDCHLQEHRLLAGATGLLCRSVAIVIVSELPLHASPRWTVSRKILTKVEKLPTCSLLTAKVVVLYPANILFDYEQGWLGLGSGGREGDTWPPTLLSHGTHHSCNSSPQEWTPESRGQDDIASLKMHTVCGCVTSSAFFKMVQIHHLTALMLKKPCISVAVFMVQPWIKICHELFG